MRINPISNKIKKIATKSPQKKMGGRFLVPTQTAKKTETAYYSSIQDNLGKINRGIAKSSAILSENVRLSKYRAPFMFKMKKHSDFVLKNLWSKKDAILNGRWCLFPSSSGKQIPWKMHIYSDNEADWQKMHSVVSKYLDDNDIAWKTIGSLGSGIEDLNDGFQKGKAFTIYPHSKEEFAKVAHDLNHIIKKNKLELSGSDITGDKPLGQTGRLFYRYEFCSGKYKDEVVDTSIESGNSFYNAIYQGNRSGHNYLASDMTISDDPWADFDPNIHSATIR